MSTCRVPWGDAALDWARARNSERRIKLLLAAGATNGTRTVKLKIVPDRQVPKDEVALNSLIRRSSTRAIELLHRTSDGFLESSVVQEQKCVSCHQQTLPAVAFAWARERGIPIDEHSVARQVQDQVRYWSQDDKIANTYEMIRPQPDTAVLVGYGLTGLAALGYAPDFLTDAMVWYLASTQNADGSWPAAASRPPMEDGPIQGTAFAIRVFQLYPLAGRKAEFAQRIGRAREYLLNAQPDSFNQQVFQLLGLGWAGASREQLDPYVQAVVEKQQDDGGWSQLEGVPPDAWATGQALVALNTVGGLETSDPVYQRDVRFLLRTQFDDGSWYVRSRAWPFQPHFESGFPHGKDQWISAGGTAWAVMALLLTQQKVGTPPQTNWMAIQVPDPKAESGVETIPVASIVPTGPKTVDFDRDIRPLLERSCIGCHSGERGKGQLLLDTRASLLKGGQSGDPAVVPGRPAESLLVQFAKGEVEDLEMPPRGKRQKYPGLTEGEIQRLETWIHEGAAWPEGVSLKQN